MRIQTASAITIFLVFVPALEAQRRGGGPGGGARGTSPAFRGTGQSGGSDCRSASVAEHAHPADHEPDRPRCSLRRGRAPVKRSDTTTAIQRSFPNRTKARCARRYRVPLLEPLLQSLRVGLHVLRPLPEASDDSRPTSRGLSSTAGIGFEFV